MANVEIFLVLPNSKDLTKIRDIIRETADLKTLLLNIDMYEKNVQRDPNNDPALNNLKTACIERATALEGNKM